ncbi:MAG: phosphatase PAP2 family protein [Firmicutes bacterium]|jgi:membrane-associated phospholipid phosphatase|nr:phosphatase PAP2 family protein [Bacillota bacterium]
MKKKEQLKSAGTSSRPGKGAVAASLTFSLLLALILFFFWEETRSLDFILSLQPRSAVEESLFRAFTFLGDDQFFMLFFGVLIWCVDKKAGFRTGVVLLLSGIYSGLLKELTNLERPALPGIIHPGNKAFPSGHALTAVAFWGYLAAQIDKVGFWAWAVFAIVMVSISRLVLGHHFLGDVLGGIALGIPFLLLILYLTPLLGEKCRHRTLPLPFLVGITLAVPVFLAVIVPGPDTPKLMGLLAGAACGYVLEGKYVKLAVSASFIKQVIKAVIGFVVLFGIVMGLGPLLPSSVNILGFTRYGAGGLWVTFLAPALFKKLKLLA